MIGHDRMLAHVEAPTRRRGMALVRLAPFTDPAVVVREIAENPEGPYWYIKWECIARCGVCGYCTAYDRAHQWFKECSDRYAQEAQTAQDGLRSSRVSSTIEPMPRKNKKNSVRTIAMLLVGVALSSIVVLLSLWELAVWVLR